MALPAVCWERESASIPAAAETSAKARCEVTTAGGLVFTAWQYKSVYTFDFQWKAFGLSCMYYLYTVCTRTQAHLHIHSCNSCKRIRDAVFVGVYNHNRRCIPGRCLQRSVYAVLAVPIVPQCFLCTTMKALRRHRARPGTVTCNRTAL